MSEVKAPLKGLAAIQEAVAKPITVKFNYHGQPCEIEARHLTPHESELLKLQLDEVQPPIIRGKGENEDRFDYADKGFQQTRTRIANEVRAQAIFWCCPEFQELAAKNSLPIAGEAYSPANKAGIVKFMQGQLVEEVLDTIYNAIARAEVHVAQQVNLS